MKKLAKLIKKLFSPSTVVQLISEHTLIDDVKYYRILVDGKDVEYCTYTTEYKRAVEMYNLVLKYGGKEPLIKSVEMEATI
jgi:hypothetical protein